MTAEDNVDTLRARAQEEFIRMVVVWATHSASNGRVDWRHVADRARQLLADRA